MNYEEQKINETLWDSDDEGIIVMHDYRNYGVWMRCRNHKGDWLSPTCFAKGYKSRHAAQRDFKKCGGQALSTRSLILV